MHLSKNKHAFLDPRGWSIFPRPALRETPRIPRSPSLTLPSFHHAGPLGPGPLTYRPYARSLPRLIPPYLKFKLSLQSFEHAFDLRGCDKPQRDWLLSS